MCDLLWSDPEDANGFGMSPRGAGFLFGPDVVQNFCETNKMDLICRQLFLALLLTWSLELINLSWRVTSGILMKQF